MSVSARIARTSSGKWDGVVLLDTFLLHAEKPRPPRGEHGLEAGACGGTDGENAKRVRGFDRGRLIIAQQVHLREDDAVRLLRELQRIRVDLGPKLIVFRLPIDGVDRDEERQDARSLDVTEELKTEPTSFVRAL